MRELTLSAVFHPEVIRHAKRVLQRVDHPSVDPIQQGQAALGWEGDKRLQMYVDLHKRVWVLMRLEHDAKYREVCRSPFDAGLNEGTVNRLIANLVTIDRNRGFDLHLHVVEHNHKRDKQEQSKSDAKTEATADKLAHALRKDSVHVI